VTGDLYKKPATVDPAAIRARADAARRPPWVHELFHGTVVLPGSIGEPFGFEATRADLAFIASARSDVPELLDVIDVLARLLLNAECQIGIDRELVDKLAEPRDDRDNHTLLFTYRCEEVIDALALLGLDTEEKRNTARAKLSWAGGGTLGGEKGSGP
jgi:hypothetical protein